MEKYNNGFKPQADISSRNKKAKQYIIIMLIAFLIYILGFVYFALNIQYKTDYPTEKTDAIIALTGETIRITESIKELAKSNAHKLFISGVHRQAPIEKVINNTINEINKLHNPIYNTNNLKAKIEIGKAENTIENALESAIWVRKNNIKSIRLITSYYHVPRSKLIFDKYLPNTLIIYHPISLSHTDFTSIFNSQTLYLLFSEYNKYILTYIWNITGIEANTILKIQGQL